MTRTIALLLAGALCLAACGGGSPVTKAGGKVVKARTLDLEMTDVEDSSTLYFEKQVTALSGGSLRLKVSDSQFSSTDTNQELKLPAAVRSGNAEMGLVPARDLVTLGYSAFQALGAPFLVTTVKQSVALEQSTEAGQLLKTLRDVHAIGMLDMEPRQVLSVNPIFTAADLRGQKMRINPDPETAEIVKAWGATSTVVDVPSHVTDLLGDGSLSAAETSPTYIQDNGYDAVAPYLSSWSWFPKMNVLIVNPKIWASLGHTQQQTLIHALVNTQRDGPGPEENADRILSQMCAKGMVVDEPSPAQLAGIVAAARGGGPSSPVVLKIEQRIRTAIAQPSVTPLEAYPYPPDCAIAHSPAQARADHTARIPKPFVHHGGAAIPDGTYLTTITADEWAKEGVSPDEIITTKFVWKFHDGTFSQTGTPEGQQPTTLRGTYGISGDELTLRYVGPGAGTDETVRWSYYRGQLSFAVINVDELEDRTIFTVHPWVKTG